MVYLYVLKSLLSKVIDHDEELDEEPGPAMDVVVSEELVNSVTF